MLKSVFFVLVILSSHMAHAALTGTFSGEYQRGKLNCIAQIELEQNAVNVLNLYQFDEYCEDASGNEYSSSLSDAMTYERLDAQKLKITQAEDSVIVYTISNQFKENDVAYDFKVQTEDGELEIVENFVLDHDQLLFSSDYYLDGKKIISRSGTLQKK